MTTQEFAISDPNSQDKPRRVVEAEIRLPRWDELKLPTREDLPTVDVEPLLRVAGNVLLTGLGLGVLAVRGMTAAVKAAHQAGLEAAEHPGPLTSALLRLARGKEAQASKKAQGLSIPVLPIQNYDVLPWEEVVSRLEGLSEQQLRVLRDYEAAHKNRVKVLRAIDERLGAA